jgi:hypothetical protein
MKLVEISDYRAKSLGGFGRRKTGEGLPPV